MTSTWRERLGLPATRGRGRLLWASMIDATGTGLFLPFQLVYFVQTTTLSLATVGSALTVAAVVALPLPTALGPLVDRYGPRRVVAVGNVVSAIGFVGYLVVDRFWTVALVALLTNAGVTTFWTASSALVSIAADEGERSRWFGLIRALRNAGIGLGGLLAAALLAAVGETAFHVLVVANAVSYASAAFFTATWRPPRDEVAALPHHEPEHTGFRAVLRDRAFLVLVALHLLMVLAMVAPTLLLAVYVTRSLGGPTWAAALLFAVNTAMIALGQTTLTRHVEHRDRVRIVALGTTLFAASFVVLGSLVAAPSSLVVGGLVLWVVVFSLGEMAQMAGVSDLVVAMSPPHLRGRYQGVYQLSWGLGGAIAPAAFAWLLSVGPVWPWAVAGACCAVATAGLLALHASVPEHARLGQDAGWNVSSNTRSMSRLEDQAESGVDQ